jgi:hypothetical protein
MEYFANSTHVVPEPSLVGCSVPFAGDRYRLAGEAPANEVAPPVSVKISPPVAGSTFSTDFLCSPAITGRCDRREGLYVTPSPDVGPVFFEDSGGIAILFDLPDGLEAARTFEAEVNAADSGEK